MVVSWAHGELKHQLPPSPWAVLALSAIVFTTLMPALILTQYHPPLIAIGGTVLAEVLVIVKHFVSDILVTACVAGALIGWWVGPQQTGHNGNGPCRACIRAGAGS